MQFSPRRDGPNCALLQIKLRLPKMYRKRGQAYCYARPRYEEENKALSFEKRRKLGPANSQTSDKTPRASPNN